MRHTLLLLLLLMLMLLPGLAQAQGETPTPTPTESPTPTATLMPTESPTSAIEPLPTLYPTDLANTTGALNRHGEALTTLSTTPLGWLVFGVIFIWLGFEMLQYAQRRR